MLLGAIMGLPSRTAGGLQLLFICGLPVAIFVYRYLPLISVVYGILPLLNFIFCSWIALPFFFKGISASVPLVNWAFATTAIVGYLWHLSDRRNEQRQREEYSGSDASQH
jgi:hypothetical protein